ncbi:hypothetical protein EG68_05631 [Paragonimus skrjabini miyazakii]|uniref:Uncharacterized protein n=1 Tax=Paragonimus skrjabini miyazakii TaxID=59628 RepID=A0A8S9Z109_9TREM|nr:hypothetical protein EG68_05631 [Paragonimus skrjabini miyazakii]
MRSLQFTTILTRLLALSLICLVIGAQKKEYRSDDLNKWTVLEPRKDLPAIHPTHYGKDKIHFKFVSRVWYKPKRRRFYKCLSCQNCILDQVLPHQARADCVECAIILSRSGPPLRVCNRSNHSICQTDRNARCCRSDFCNTSISNLQRNNSILTITVLFALIVYTLRLWF